MDIHCRPRYNFLNLTKRVSTRDIKITAYMVMLYFSLGNNKVYKYISCYVCLYNGNSGKTYPLPLKTHTNINDYPLLMNIVIFEIIFFCVMYIKINLFFVWNDTEIIATRNYNERDTVIICVSSRAHIQISIADSNCSSYPFQTVINLTSHMSISRYYSSVAEQ